MPAPRTLFDKIWDSHVIFEKPDGDALLHIDRNFVHEGSFHAFGALAKDGRKVRMPSQTFAVADHYVPTVGRERGVDAAEDADARHMIRLLEENCRINGVAHFGIDDARQGIVHVIGPELGITQPGLTITCGDSHTSTHGALGAYAFGTGASQLKQILATQCLWLKRPKTLRVTVNGKLAPGVTGKDVVLAIIAKIGTAGATGHVIEFAGPVIRGLSIEGRLTVCNMAIEAGGRAGMIAPDDAVYEYLHGREYVPRGADWDTALAQWRLLPGDDGARFDREVSLDGAKLEPMVTWGTSPEEALPVSARVPEPKTLGDANQQAHATHALAYMDLKPGMLLTDIKIDRAFIGSCTNGRIEDLRAAAAVLKGRKAAIPAWVSPGSTTLKRQAESEGLDRIFLDAGVEWRASGCSSCAAMNGDTVPAGMRCASTSNRNFEGRQGKGARTHLMSPAMAAAAIVTGRVTDVRKLLAGE
ncbi:MAG: 3-isopropylmalate dehydratase large subunit [Betaproteobacteria bacterium]|nr:3-isopropylmalate dehydratase large subunit [Betaproteobacteria bacterium]MDH4293386.1 3-isopropylmalate dehydratase large subunit [Betaproteobacteria bacterium]